jgi:hypothetical protein
MNRKVIFAALVVVFLAAVFFDLTVSLSAQQRRQVSENEWVIERGASHERATPEMLAYALNFKTASDYAVFAAKGVDDRGFSAIKGKIGDPQRRGSIEADSAAEKDLAAAFSAIRQLPCAAVAGGGGSERAEAGSLNERRFTPGVYCLDSSVVLNGEIFFDGQGDAAAVFVVRIAGSLDARTGARFALVNEARAPNIFFVADDSASIGANVAFKANILARSGVTLEQGASVAGKTLSTEGRVNLDSNNLGGGTGILQICKILEPSPGGVDLSDRIFRFQIGALIVEVPPGSCSAPIELPTGPHVITELNNGRFVSSVGTWTGNFQLVGVEKIASPSPSTLGAVNLNTRAAQIFIAEGDISQQLVLRFTNKYAITGFIEICKHAATGDPDVSGFFTYTVEGVYATNQQNPTNQVLQQFTAPVGNCTGPIAVTIANPVPIGTPRESTVRVTEIGRSGYFLDSAQAFPADRQIGSFVAGMGVNASGATFANPGGGFATFRIIEGGIAFETVARFNNRTSPAPLKVCKIAGPGVNLGTMFQFDVTGTSSATGQQVTRSVSVPAGPADLGGFCQFVTDPASGDFQRFVVGTNVLIDENVPSGNYVSNISALSPVTIVASTAANPARVQLPSGAFENVFPNADFAGGRVITQVRAGTNEISFTNAALTPTLLKICKIATAGIASGTPFTFDIVLNSHPAATVPPVTVPAGPASQGGFCQFAQGPYAPTNTTPSVGRFNAGQTVTVTERAATGMTVTGISTLSGGTLTTNLPNRSATLTLSTESVNEIAFTNSLFTPAILKICKLAGPGVALGAAFTFDIAVNGLPNLTIAPLTVPAGPANQGGFCGIVQGPYASNAFNSGQTVTVTERASPGLRVTAIASATGPVTVNLPARSATLTLGSGSAPPPFHEQNFLTGSKPPNAEAALLLNNSLHEVSFTNADATPPSISPTVSGALGDNGYYVSNVAVEWSVADAESSITSSAGCDTTTVATDTAGTTFTCTATSGGGTTSQSVTVKRDATAPNAVFQPANPAPNANGWNNTDVSFAFTTSDNLSGVASVSAASPLLLSAEGSAVTGAVTVTDNAGNSATIATPAVKIDKTQPALAGLNNVTIDANVPSIVNYNVTATDALTASPVVACVPASGQTFPVGVTTVNCSAADLAGNQSNGNFQVAVFTAGQEPVPVGSNVTIEPETGLPDAELGLTFTQVTATGVTTVAPLNDPASAGDVPGGFSISNSIAYQIETTAQFTGPVILAFQVPFTDADNNGIDDVSGAAFADLRILHREQTGVDASNQPIFGLVDRTILPTVPQNPLDLPYLPNLATRTIYARTTSFSPFFVAQKIDRQISPLYNPDRAFRRNSAAQITLQVLNAAGTVNLSSPETILTVRGVTRVGGDLLIPASSPGNSNPANVFSFSGGVSAGGHYRYTLKTDDLSPGNYVLSFYIGTNRAYFYTVKFAIR